MRVVGVVVVTYYATRLPTATLSDRAARPRPSKVRLSLRGVVGTTLLPIVDGIDGGVVYTTTTPVPRACALSVGRHPLLLRLRLRLFRVPGCFAHGHARAPRGRELGLLVMWWGKTYIRRNEWTGKGKVWGESVCVCVCAHARVREWYCCG